VLQRKNLVGRTIALGAALACFGIAATLPATAEASHYSLADIPTLVESDKAERLKQAGVGTTDELLQRAAKPKDRAALAKASGLTTAALLDLARRCDLLRLKGVGPEMVLLLEAAGVRTAADLAKRSSTDLTAAAASANQTRKISNKLPTEAQFQHWIAEAKKLPTVLVNK